MKKAGRLFLLMILLTVSMTFMTACHLLGIYDDEPYEEPKIYNDDKGFFYVRNPEYDIFYDSSTHTSSVRVYLRVNNSGSAAIETITLECVFLDDYNNQLDRKSSTFDIHLLPDYDIYVSWGDYSLVFNNVAGHPAKVSVLNASASFGLTEKEQHDAEIRSERESEPETQAEGSWLSRNKWIWAVVAGYVIIGIIAAVVCGYFRCADFELGDADMWISIACGVLWPLILVGLVVLGIVSYFGFFDFDILSWILPIRVKFKYDVDGKKVTLRGKGSSYHEAYNQLSLKDLRLICKKEGLSDYETLDKTEIIDFIMEYMGQEDKEEPDPESDDTEDELNDLRRLLNKLDSGYDDEDDEDDDFDYTDDEDDVKPVRKTSVKSIPKVTMNDIAGLKEAKEAFHDRVILPIKHRELFEKYGKDTGGGILLYGLPGTGKTMFAQAVANELNADFYSIKCSDIMSKWYGESEEKIKKLFAKARKARVSVIFFDEFEALGRKRNSSDGDSGITTVQEILAQMQGVEKHKNILLVLAATNCPWDIDSALLRPGRFNDKIYIPLPDAEARTFIIKKGLSNVKLSGDISISDLAESLDGFNSADVVEFCEQIKMIAIKAELANESAVIDANDIETVMGKVHSSILLSDIEKMELFRRTN